MGAGPNTVLQPTPAAIRVRREVTVQPAANPDPTTAPPGAVFPIGFFSFALQGLQPGGSAAVTMILPPGVTPNRYFRYGPTPDNPTPHWFDFSHNGRTGVMRIGDIILLNFVDGERGDYDLLANGRITDPGAPSCVGPKQRPCHVIVTASLKPVV